MTSILKNLQNEARQFSLHDPEGIPAPQSPAPEEEEAEVNTNGTTTWLVLTAQVISLVYSPFYLPVFAFVALFSFSYLKLLPLQTKVWLTLLVFFFTVLLPRLGIYVYRKLNGWTKRQMGRRQRRYVPYVLCIVSYAALLSMLYKLHMPRFTLGVIAGALTIQIVCTVLNSRVKVSMHAAASGGVIGALMAFSLIFSFNPTGWLCLTTLLCGMVCTARLILRQHTPRDLGWGVLVGVICGFCCIVLI